MSGIEYSKLSGSFLITRLNTIADDEIKISFNGVKDASFLIDGKVFDVRSGALTIKKNLLRDGIHTPVLKEDESFTVCDKIKIEAGIISPAISCDEQIFRLTKLLACREERFLAAERKISELSSAVYGKSIL